MNSSSLWAGNAPIADACLTHPFVTGLADGSTPLDAFRHYVGQDAFFLDAFARAYALCLAKSPDHEALRTCRTRLNGAMDELDLHAAYAAEWDVDLHPSPTPATRAYTDFLLQVAALEPVSHALAAMAPCMRLYAWLGQQLLPDLDPTSPYADWVRTYADPEFEALAATLEDMIDRLGGDPGRMAEHYATAMRLEHDFFASAHEIGTAR